MISQCRIGKNFSGHVPKSLCPDDGFAPRADRPFVILALIGRNSFGLLAQASFCA
jgi:hypothetical protein